MIKVQKSKLIKIIRYDDHRRQQMKLRSNTHGCELMKGQNCDVVNIFELKDRKARPTIATILHKNNETNDKIYRKVAFLMYTEMANFRPQS